MPKREGLAIEAEDLHVELGRKPAVEIVRGVSLKLSYGQVCAIAGPNGAGKSTLLRALLGLVPSTAKRLRLAGSALAELDRLERARRVAYVPQRSQLDLGLPVLDIVAQGRYPHRESSQHAREHAKRALSEAGIAELAERNYLQLSGGEKRMVMIARALSTEAPVLCLDEPTASLDIHNHLRILQLMRRLAQQGRSIVVVLHELNDLRRYADRVILMHEGRVHAQGHPADVVVSETIEPVYQVALRANQALDFELLKTEGER